MISQKIKKLKKYLFFISIMFFVLTLSHLAYSYLYSDSKNSPVKWWTISEWIIGNFPSLNPLVSLNSDSNRTSLQIYFKIWYRSEKNSLRHSKLWYQLFDKHRMYNKRWCKMVKWRKHKSWRYNCYLSAYKGNLSK